MWFIKMIESVNLTVLLGLITVCLTSMGILVKIFGSSKIDEEKLIDSRYLSELKKKVDEIKIKNEAIEINKESVSHQIENITGQIENSQQNQIQLSDQVNNQFKEIGIIINEYQLKITSLKELMVSQTVEIEKLKIQYQYSNKTLDELKIDNRNLVNRLDELLKQFLHYMEE